MLPSKPSRPMGSNSRISGTWSAAAKTSAVAERDKRAVLRAVDQPQLGFEHDHAGAFGADQRARHVKSVFRQQFIEVVAGDAPGNSRIPRADQVGVLVANGAQLGINLAATPALAR